MIVGKIDDFLKNYRAEYEKEIKKVRDEFEKRKRELVEEDRRVRRELKEKLIKEMERKFKREVERKKLYAKINELEEVEKKKEEVVKEIIEESVERIRNLKGKERRNVMRELLRRAAEKIDDEFLLIQPARNDRLSESFVKEVVKKGFKIIENGDFDFGVRVFNRDKSVVGDFSLNSLLEAKRLHVESLLLQKLDEVYG